MAIDIATFTRSKIIQFWEFLLGGNGSVAAPLIGARRLRVVSAADTDLTIDGTNMAIARALLFKDGTTATLVAADDDPSITSDGQGGRCAIPLPGTVALVPIHTRRVVSTDATKVIALF